jgi:hypothetical protein
MSPWLRTLLGLEDNEVPAGADARLELTGIPGDLAFWIAGTIAAGAVLLIVLLYRTERDLSPFQRVTLAALRLVALAIVLFMLLDPRILTELRREREAHTILLYDASGSMAQRDDYKASERYALEGATGVDLSEPRTRAELAIAAMDSQRFVERLEERNRVRAYAFGESLRALDRLDADSAPPPDAGETRLGDAVRGALKQAASDLVAAIVVISDGRLTAGEPVEKAAQEAALRGVPIHAVALGKSRVPRNHAVTGFSGPEIAEPGYPIRLEAAVEASGTEGLVTVTLSREASGGAIQEVERRTVEAKGLQVSTTMVFVDTLERPGVYRYVVSIARHEEEADPTDNERDLEVAVAEDTCRVLLVAGCPTYEYRFLRNFLIRDDGLQVSCWLSSADKGYPQDGDIVIREAPADAEKLRQYDVVILLDPDPAHMPPAAVLADFVLEEGGGLAYVAGECHGAKVFSAPALARLAAILPVEGGGGGQAARMHTRPWRPALTVQGAEHPMCRLHDEADKNAQLWSILPPFYYLTAVRGLRPAASALLERSPGEIVAATQRSGAGYTVFLGTDDMHRWRAYRDGLHERFWGGVVRYLAAGKRLAGSKEATLLADRDRYSLGDDVVLEAAVIDERRKPVLADRLEAGVERLADGTPAAPAGGAGPGRTRTSVKGAGAESFRLNLLPIAGRPGWYAGRFRPETPGRYLARLPSAATAKASFAVLSLSKEWEDPSPDIEVLEELTRRTGGDLVGLEGLARIAERIPDRRVSEVIGRSASTIWDSGALLLIFALLVITEWVLRKVWRLN